MTATAAIDSGQVHADLDARRAQRHRDLRRAARNFGGEDFGAIDLTTALTNSVNTVWAQVGEQLGKATMDRYMQPLRLLPQGRSSTCPRTRWRASGDVLRKDGELRLAADRRVRRHRPRGDRAGRLQATPLQMAMVAAAVANGGRLMRPLIGDRSIDADGRTTMRQPAGGDGRA